MNLAEELFLFAGRLGVGIHGVSFDFLVWAGKERTFSGFRKTSSL